MSEEASLTGPPGFVFRPRTRARSLRGEGEVVKRGNLRDWLPSKGEKGVSARSRHDEQPNPVGWGAAGGVVG